MEKKYILSPARRLTEEEQKLVWKKPITHIKSQAEQRICEEVKRNWLRGEMKISNILLEGDAGSGKTQLAKALSAEFGLPYTKVTCFADMDKSDILGSILPVLSDENENSKGVEYKYYPSEIIRAYENGWLLEIQEPTVIRDAAVLMALNSALEPDGSINLPTRIVHRHPDFIAVITTNRGYNGCRPLNESLRDRVQHSEKMDLPEIDVMVERATAKMKCTNHTLLYTFAKTIIELDKTAKANAIKGVAGMRSYFFWTDAVLQGSEIIDALYHKVIYKITTDADEIDILEKALSERGLLTALEDVSSSLCKTNGEVMEIHTEGEIEAAIASLDVDSPPAVALQKSPDSKDISSYMSESATKSRETETGNEGAPIYHELTTEEQTALSEEKKKFRKFLNQQARESVKGTFHEKVGLIVHRPEASLGHHREYNKMVSELMPIIRELIRKTAPLLEHEVSVSFSKNRVYGTKFHAENISAGDHRYFSRKRPPEEEPSLAVALRIDQSASMKASGRLEAAKQAAVAVYEFCTASNIPLLIYGDTADRSPIEKMSMYSYIDWEKPELNDKYSLMAIQSHSNNRDGMALRILAEKLVKASQSTKLLISISDGQPKAMPDYTGNVAIDDMKQIIKEYSRKGIVFLAAAIGQDKDTISNIYGQEHFLDMSNLGQLPIQLIRIISRFL